LYWAHLDSNLQFTGVDFFPSLDELFSPLELVFLPDKGERLAFKLLLLKLLLSFTELFSALSHLLLFVEYELLRSLWIKSPIRVSQLACVS